MLLGEIAIIVAWSIWPLIAPRVRSRRFKEPLFKEAELGMEISRREIFWNMFYDIYSLGLFASSIYTLALATLTLLVAFQPFDYKILLLSALLYAAAAAMAACAWSRSKKTVGGESSYSRV